MYSETNNDGKKPVDFALELASYGFQMHPLQERNKTPLLAQWPKRASEDPKRIESWANQYPSCNWGVACGEESGIVVIDIDIKNGGDKSWQELTDKYGEPVTPTVQTGGGGKHLYFLYPHGTNVKNGVEKIGKGIDVRGKNGQVVAPGSVHPNGNTYEWIVKPQDVTFAEVPEWLLNLITDEVSQEHTAVGGELAVGMRNDSIYHNALGLFRQGASAEFVTSTMKTWLEDQGQTLPADELSKTIDSAEAAAKAKPVSLDGWSEQKNAEYLIDRYGVDLIYVEGLGWYQWNGKFWKPDYGDVAVTKFFVMCMKELQTLGAEKIATAHSRADAQSGKSIADWAIRSQSKNAITSSIALAARIESARKQPSEIDSVATNWLLNCNNGTVDLRTGELRPHNKADLITKFISIDYRPDAKAPFWLSSLDLIFCGNQRLIDYMQRALGYSITGVQDEKCFFICWGESGENGKSTILETIQNMLGNGYAQMSDMVVVTSSTLDLRVSSSLAKLQGARFVSMNEAEENQKISEALIKQLTGGDTVQACFKHRNPFEYRPVFKLWIRTNEKPIIRSQNEAIWNRVKLIPFTQPIPKDRRLPRSEVDERLEAEAPGILAWLVQGILLWQAEGGLTDPPEVTAAGNEYRVDSDLVKHFADECIETVEPKEKKSLPTSAAYTAFSNWCRQNGERYIMTRIKFTKRLLAVLNYTVPLKRTKRNGEELDNFTLSEAGASTLYGDYGS